MNPPRPFSLLRVIRRHPAFAILTLLTVIFAGVDAVAFKHVFLLGQTHALRQHDGEDLSALLLRGPALRDEAQILTAATRRIDESLVIETSLAENLWYFYKIEEDTRARLSELRQLSAPLADTGAAYRTIPYSLRLTGTYEQVSAFLHRIETGPRLARITSFNFVRNSPDSPVVSLELGLNLLGRP